MNNERKVRAPICVLAVGHSNSAILCINIYSTINRTAQPRALGCRAARWRAKDILHLRAEPERSSVGARVSMALEWPVCLRLARTVTFAPLSPEELTLQPADRMSSQYSPSVTLSR